MGDFVAHIPKNMLNIFKWTLLFVTYYDFDCSKSLEILEYKLWGK